MRSVVRNRGAAVGREELSGYLLTTDMVGSSPDSALEGWREMDSNHRPPVTCELCWRGLSLLPARERERFSFLRASNHSVEPGWGTV